MAFNLAGLYREIEYCGGVLSSVSRIHRSVIGGSLANGLLWRSIKRRTEESVSLLIPFCAPYAPMKNFGMRELGDMAWSDMI